MRYFLGWLRKSHRGPRTIGQFDLSGFAGKRATQVWIDPGKLTEKEKIEFLSSENFLYDRKDGGEIHLPLQ